jgi:hypothetical protein
MKKLILGVLALLALASSAQTVYTKDGVPLGDGALLVRTCKEAADASLKGRAMVLQGIEVDTRAYCECAMLNLIPSLESSDIIEANESGQMMDFLLQGENLNILMNCIQENSNIDSSEVNFSRLLRETEAAGSIGDMDAQTFFLKSCLEGVRQQDPAGDVISDQMAKEYCQCAIDALMESDEYTFEDVMEAEDPQSDVFQKIVVPCAEEVFGVTREAMELSAEQEGYEQSIQDVKKRGASKAKKR